MWLSLPYVQQSPVPPTPKKLSFYSFGYSKLNIHYSTRFSFSCHKHCTKLHFLAIEKQM